MTFSERNDQYRLMTERFLEENLSDANHFCISFSDYHGSIRKSQYME